MAEKLVLGIPPEVATYAMAAPFIGCRSGHALRMRFSRGLYPREFLVHMTPKIPGVAVRELVAWIKAQRHVLAMPAAGSPAPTEGAQL
jgi:hypothetical protein